MNITGSAPAPLTSQGQCHCLSCDSENVPSGVCPQTKSVAQAMGHWPQLLTLKVPVWGLQEERAGFPSKVVPLGLLQKELCPVHTECLCACVMAGTGSRQALVCRHGGVGKSALSHTSPRVLSSAVLPNTSLLSVALLLFHKDIRFLDPFGQAFSKRFPRML